GIEHLAEGFAVGREAAVEFVFEILVERLVAYLLDDGAQQALELFDRHARSSSGVPKARGTLIPPLIERSCIIVLAVYSNMHYRSICFSRARVRRPQRVLDDSAAQHFIGICSKEHEGTSSVGRAGIGASPE